MLSQVLSDSLRVLSQSVKVLSDLLEPQDERLGRVADYHGGVDATSIRCASSAAGSPSSALLTGERLEISDPGESEDIGKDWADPRALTEYGEREPTDSWTWAGVAHTVTGRRTWGGGSVTVDGTKDKIWADYR